VTYASSGNPYPDEMAILVRYPRTPEQEKAARESWPWLSGTIVQRCGPDEWQVCVEAREVAMLEDGTGPPDGTADEDLFFPCCFRDSSELRAAPDGQ
jgi:hypothetical protein